MINMKMIMDWGIMNIKSNVEAVRGKKIDEIYTGIGINAYLMAKYL